MIKVNGWEYEVEKIAEETRRNLKTFVQSKYMTQTPVVSVRSVSDLQSPSNLAKLYDFATDGKVSKQVGNSSARTTIQTPNGLLAAEVYMTNSSKGNYLNVDILVPGRNGAYFVLNRQNLKHKVTFDSSVSKDGTVSYSAPKFTQVNPSRITFISADFIRKQLTD